MNHEWEAEADLIAKYDKRVRLMPVPEPGTWRVTVHDDGTIERVALYRSMHDRGCQGAWGRCSCGAPRRWVDAEDGAR